MSEHLYLVGSEDVRRAGADMSSAADQMRQAASAIQDALVSHQQFLDRWLAEFREVIEALKPEVGR